MHMLIHPHPDRASTDNRWTMPSDRPDWTTTFVRCEKLQRTQNIYEDVRVAEKTNSRLVWSSHLLNAMTPLLAANDDAWAPVLANVLETIEAEKDAIRNKENDAIRPSNVSSAAPTDEPKDVALGAVELFRRVLTHVTGLAGKQPARIDVVSPLLLPEAQGDRWRTSWPGSSSCTSGGSWTNGSGGTTSPSAIAACRFGSKGSRHWDRRQRRRRRARGRPRCVPSRRGTPGGARRR